MQELWIKALEASQKGSRFCFATIIEATTKGTPGKTGAKMLVFEDGSIWGTIGGGRNEKAAIAECLNAISSQKSKTVTYNYFGHVGESVCGGQMTVFIEPIKPVLHLVICGAGHIALPLSVTAKLLGFKVTIIDSRKAYANSKRFPHVDKIIASDPAKMLVKMKFDASVFIAIVTHGNETDFECLKAVIQTQAGYIGVISSQPKRVKFLKRLKQLKVDQRYLKAVHIPMGLDIGSQLPQEIAISIIAHIIKVKNIAFLGTDKFKTFE